MRNKVVDFVLDVFCSRCTVCDKPNLSVTGIICKPCLFAIDEEMDTINKSMTELMQKGDSNKECTKTVSSKEDLKPILDDMMELAKQGGELNKRAEILHRYMFMFFHTRHIPNSLGLALMVMFSIIAGIALARITDIIRGG